jgi:hypothetical protein
MILAGLFASLLFIGLILGDWFYFIRLTPDAIRYGCTVARTHDRWTASTLATIRTHFSTEGVLMLPHGVAWLYPELSQIAIRPQFRLFSLSFRTAWPVKGLIHLSSDDPATKALCVKRIPWSSALLTMVWFAVVSIGSLTFAISYTLEGGFASLRGTLIGGGMIVLALCVLFFGFITVLISYRLENGRLTKVYDELREVFEGPPKSESDAAIR